MAGPSDPGRGVPEAEALLREGRFDALADLCRDVLSGSLDPREAVPWQLRLAEACERSGDLGSAVAANQAVLAARPRERRALRALQRLHRAAGHADALTRALESELALCAGSEEIPLRLELVDLLERHESRGPECLAHLRRVLDLEPERDRVRERAIALAQELGDFAEVVGLLERAIRRTGSVAERAALRARQASLLAGPLDAPTEAVRCWREALALDPTQHAVRESLRSAEERLGRWPEALALLLEASHEAGPEARRALLERGAELAARHGTPGAALPWLLRLTALHPDDPALAGRLAALRREAGLADATVAREAWIADPPVAREAGLADATVAREARIADPPVAREAGLADATVAREARIAVSPIARRGVPALVPAEAVSPSARAGTGERPPARDEAAARAHGLEQELAALGDATDVYAERRLAIEHELAHLHLDALGDADAALPHLRALVEAPRGARGVPALERERAWAEDRLLALLRATDATEELAARLAARLQRCPRDAAGWIELARLHAIRRFAPAAAADAFRAALEAGAPLEEALPGLRAAAEALGDWNEVARSFELEIAATPFGAARGALYRALGEVAWRRLGATTRASRAFAAALEADPRDRVSLGSLRELLASVEDWRGALALLESEIDLLPPSVTEERRALWLRAGDVAADRLGDFARAARAYRRASADGPLGRAERERLAHWMRESGDLDGYIEVATALCDEGGAPPDVDTLLCLSRALLSTARAAEARERAKLAVVHAPERDDGWELLAEAELAIGRPEDAAAALVRAAERSAPTPAVERLLRAAGLAAPDATFAHALCEAACARDPGSLAAHAVRARAAAALGLDETFEAAALRAAEIAAMSPSRGGAASGTGDVVALAAEAAASARAAGRLGLAARLLSALGKLAPDDAAVLRARAEVLHAAGDVVAAARAAKALLSQDVGAGKDAALLAIVGDGLLAEGACDEAAEAFEASVGADPACVRSHERLADALERAGRGREAAARLDRLAGEADEETRVRCWLRATGIESADPDPDAAARCERRLAAVLALRPGDPEATALLVRRRLAADRPEDALAYLAHALAAAPAPPARAALERLTAAALERTGAVESALEALTRALEAEPGSIEAARVRAAWLRARGAWHEAARTLGGALEVADRQDCARRSVPETEREECADAWLELAALHAGPLDTPDAAIAAARRAVELRPEDRRAHELLADLAARTTGHAEEALSRALEILEATPERIESLHALQRLAEQSGNAFGAAAAGALGATLDPATPLDANVPLHLATGARLENPVWERARLLAQSVARELAHALGASLRVEPPLSHDPVEAFRLAALVAEAELSAAALVPLRDEEVAGVLKVVAGLAEGRETLTGDGRLVNALSGAIGRGARRRARDALGGTTPEEIAEIDVGAWRAALRGLAHAAAVDATGGRLRAALEALCDDADGRGAGAPESLAARIALAPAARDLFRRATSALGRVLATHAPREAP